MAKDLKFNHYKTLNTLLTIYNYPPEEVLVLEAIANGMDAKAKKIDIKLSKDNDKHFITFHNDGIPMSKQQFEKYHTVSSSTKVKGQGIGFAGVGAKIFLGSEKETEIITITGKNEKSVLISRMYTISLQSRDGKDVKYETSLEEPKPESIVKIVKNSKFKHNYGTSYRVTLNSKEYLYLKQKITKILQFWFNYGMISNGLQLIVDGILVKSEKPLGNKTTRIIVHKNKKITCDFWICKEEVSEEKRHIIYNVLGKRIKNEPVEFSYQIIGNMNKQVFCETDVSILAEFLKPNKEEFEKNPYTNIVKGKIKKAFFEFLKENGLIQPANNIENSKVNFNGLSRRLDIALQRKELRFLNPFSKSTLHTILIPNNEGKITITENESLQCVNEIQDNVDNDCGTPTVGHEETIEFAKDDKGDKTGEYKERKSDGIQIVSMDFPNDPREGWIDFDNKAIVFNIGHNFTKHFENNKKSYDYNLTRVIISVIIKNKNDQEPMDALKTFEYFEKLLHEVLIND